MGAVLFCFWKQSKHRNSCCHCHCSFLVKPPHDNSNSLFIFPVFLGWCYFISEESCLLFALLNKTKASIETVAVTVIGVFGKITMTVKVGVYLLALATLGAAIANENNSICFCNTQWSQLKYRNFYCHFSSFGKTTMTMTATVSILALTSLGDVIANRNNGIYFCITQ